MGWVFLSRRQRAGALVALAVGTLMLLLWSRVADHRDAAHGGAHLMICGVFLLAGGLGLLGANSFFRSRARTRGDSALVSLHPRTDRQSAQATGLTLEQQFSALEQFLGRPIPARLRHAYADQRRDGPCLLPLATGREHEAASAFATDANRFQDAESRFASVLGHAIGNEQLQRSADHGWPPGLLVVEDAGCGIYNAVDLDDPHLRVIRYEHFDPAEHTAFPTDATRVAYREPLVPRNLQHRFTIVADHFEQWLTSADELHDI